MADLGESLDASEFGVLLEEAKRASPDQAKLDRILDHHASFLGQMQQLSQEERALFEALALRAEERCIHLRRPLQHRRRAFYTPLPSPLPPTRQKIANYDVLYPLHEGSLGSKTWVAPHPEGFLCLLKLYQPKEVDLEPRVMFRHQEMMIQRLNQIADPRVEEVLDHFLLDDGLYVQVKPFLQCVTLKRWMDVHPMRDKRIRLLQSVGEVLQVLHANGIAHMDLKPEQVLILPDPVDGHFADPPAFVLIDYDFSMVEGELTLSVGSAPYYAPEQFDRHAPRGHKAGVRADTYAFCVLMHRLLSETFPFGDGRTEPTMLDQMKHKRIFTSMTIPHKPLRKVMQQALHPKPNKRPPFQEILDVLQDPELLEHSHLFPTTRPIPPSPSSLDLPPSFLEQISHRGRLLVAGGFVIALAGVGAFLYKRGLLVRVPPLLLVLFLLGFCAFLALLLMRDED